MRFSLPSAQDKITALFGGLDIWIVCTEETREMKRRAPALRVHYPALASSGAALLGCVLLFPAHSAIAQAPPPAAEQPSQQPAQPPAPTQVQAEPQRLELGKPVERELPAGETHVYQIHAKAGQFLHVVAEQGGVGLILSLQDPEGRAIAERNDSIGHRSPEAVSTVAQASGDYQVQVRAMDPKAERKQYKVELTDLRAPTPQDRDRVAAERALNDGARLRAEGSPASLRAAIETWEASLPAWRRLDDLPEEGLTRWNLGSAYDALGQWQKAAEYYGQAISMLEADPPHNPNPAGVPIGEDYDIFEKNMEWLGYCTNRTYIEFEAGRVSYGAGAMVMTTSCDVLLGFPNLLYAGWALDAARKDGDRANEALALQLTGNVHYALAERQKALESYVQALSLQSALTDGPGQATTHFFMARVYHLLGEEQKALGSLDQALSLQRAFGDHAAEAATLSLIGLVCEGLGEKEKALDSYTQALPLQRAAGDHAGQARSLNSIGALLLALGKKKESLNEFTQALELWHALGDRGGEPISLDGIGGAYDALGEKRKALEYHGRAASLARAEAMALNKIGKAYFKENRQKILDTYSQALLLFRVASDAAGQAAVLNNLGGYYYALDEKQKALEYYNQALPLWRAGGDRTGDARTLNNLGAIYDDLGDKQKALESYKQAVQLLGPEGDTRLMATAVSNMGLLYDSLGDKKQALEFLDMALQLENTLRDRLTQGLTLAYIGKVYNSLGQKQKALDYYNQALPLMDLDRKGQAATLNNIGSVYDELGEQQKALEYLTKALKQQEELKDRAGQAATLNNIGHVYKALGELQKALDYYNLALPLFRDAGDRSGEQTVLDNIASVNEALGEKKKP